MSCPGESVEVDRRAQEFSRFNPDFQGLDILEILPNLDLLLHIGLGFGPLLHGLGFKERLNLDPNRNPE